VFTLRNIPDTYAIKSYIEEQHPKRAIVVGGGYIGIEMAENLHDAGLEVTIVELSEHVVGPLDFDMACEIHRHIRSKGVKLILGDGVKSIQEAPGGLTVSLAKETLEADLVIMAVGVRANIELARAAGLNVGRGVVVNELMQTSAVDVFAAGDAAEVVDSVSGLSVVPAIWPEAVKQGLIAARYMVESKATRADGIALNSVEIAGIPIVSVGDIDGSPTDDVITFHKGSCYRKVVMHTADYLTILAFVLTISA
jgi:NADPH-dependent 2,4-dienoyl-CoA reductase/sulfur reductase-like enzyme